MHVRVQHATAQSSLVMAQLRSSQRAQSQAQSDNMVQKV